MVASTARTLQSTSRSPLAVMLKACASTARFVNPNSRSPTRAGPRARGGDGLPLNGSQKGEYGTRSVFARVMVRRQLSGPRRRSNGRLGACGITRETFASDPLFGPPPATFAHAEEPGAAPWRG